MSEVSPSERELEILKALWELGSGSVREVHQHLCPNQELAFNTVQTLLRIMEDKGLVSHRSEGRTFIYTPRHSRERVARRFLNKVFDGSLDQLVLTLLQTEDASPDELKELEQLIARLAKTNRHVRNRRANDMGWHLAICNLVGPCGPGRVGRSACGLRGLATVQTAGAASAPHRIDAVRLPGGAVVEPGSVPPALVGGAAGHRAGARCRARR